MYISKSNEFFIVCFKKTSKDKIKHDKDFYVFTGSTVGVVPILDNGVYKGVINKLGKVSTKIN